MRAASVALFLCFCVVTSDWRGRVPVEETPIEDEESKHSQ